MNRRQFNKAILASMAAGMTLKLSPGLANMSDKGIQLTASRGEFSFREDQVTPAEVMFYNNSIPGPIIHLPQGVESTISLHNQLDQPTSVHWHGLRIANEMDGVPGMTQKMIMPEENFTYKFTPPDAGTYWYHTHQRSWEQMALGLAGVLIVDEKKPPKVDQDIVFVVDDWLLKESLQIETESLGNLHDWAHGGRIGNFITVNGKTNPPFDVSKGERIRFRMINTANSRTMTIGINQKTTSVIAIDGQPVTPYQLKDGVVTLAPGQRTDLMIDMTSEPNELTPIELIVGKDVYRVAHFKFKATAKREQLLSSSIALPMNPANHIKASKDLKHIPLDIGGGAMGRMNEATYKGDKLGMEELIKQKKIWAFNGVTGLPNEPLFKVKQGESISLDVVNDNRWLHGIHVHGHHFIDEREPNAFRDTALFLQNQKGSLTFVADNPGKWLIHCHMIEHQAGGMVTWFEVV